MRLMSVRRPLLVAAVLCCLPVPALAQQRPSAAEAQVLLQTRPDLVAQLRQRIATSGMTPDQVRARLRAEGYPENLLDAYLTGGSFPPGQDSLPNGQVFDAVRALGMSDSSDFNTIFGDSLSRSQRFRDSVTFGDSLSLEEFYVLDANGNRRLVLRTREDSLRFFSRELRRRDITDSGFVIFGRDLFSGGTTQFDANVSGPVDANYRLGPGDRLVLILTGDVEAAYNLDVTREGFVVIPQVGQVNVVNLTLAQLEDVLYSRLGRVYSGVRRTPGATTRFSINVARLRSNQVFVVGSVTRPGSYRVSSAGTALTALYAAGGPSTAGTMRRIQVRRGGRTVSTLDLYDYLLRGDASRDIRLENGDVVFVDVHGGRVRVVGEVLRPATYELTDSSTLAEVVQAAGGFTAEAATRRLQIERIVAAGQRTGGSERVLLDVTTPTPVANGEPPAVAVQPGDVIRVFRVAERVRNRAVVHGNVWRPGSVGFTPGMTVGDALRLAGGVRPDAYLGQILVTRMEPDSSRRQLRAALRDTTGAVIEDFPLQDDDDIRVFSIAEFRPDRFVAISGAVRNGGRFTYREGMTMRDLVLLAGGLEESAYLNEAEIARLPETRANGVTARTMRVPLDSTYLVERDGDGRYEGPPGLPAPAGSAPEVLLRPYDNVLVLRQPDWELQRQVFLGGEVRFPGTYALTSQKDRLTDVIKRAGGLTSEAYPAGVFFYRKSDRLGRIGIELPEVLRHSNHPDNLLLLNGDSIVVPRYNAVVNVTGAVNSPVAVSYVRGADLDYYIRAAGGPSQKADPSRAYVTQPNGKVQSIARRHFLPDGVPEPRAGSSVFVPERDPALRRDYVALIGGIASLLSALVAIVIAITSAN